MLVKKFLSPAIMLIVAGLFPLSPLSGNAPAVEAVWNSSTAPSASTPGIILKHCDRNSGGALQMDGEKSEIFQTYRLHKGFKNYLLDENGVIIAKNINAKQLSSYLN